MFIHIHIWKMETHRAFVVAVWPRWFLASTSYGMRKSGARFGAVVGVRRQRLTMAIFAKGSSFQHISTRSIPSVRLC